MKRPGPHILGERIDLKEEPGHKEDQPRNPKREQGPAVPDHPDELCEYPEAMGDRVLLVLMGHVIGDVDRNLPDGEAGLGEMMDHVRLDIIALGGEGEVL